MTGPEHYSKAQDLLMLANIRPDNFPSDSFAQAIAEAQVHATLAAAPGDDSLRQQVDGLREAIRSLSEELAAAFTRIGVLEERLHFHEQTVPHEESQA